MRRNVECRYDVGVKIYLYQYHQPCARRSSFTAKLFRLHLKGRSGREKFDKRHFYRSRRRFVVFRRWALCKIIEVKEAMGQRLRISGDDEREVHPL